MLTKEKLLAAGCALVGLITLSGLHLPQVSAVPKVPSAEPARAYRTVSATPRLAPKQVEELRDPFAVRDPWAEAPPALLRFPDPLRWPRALPGGLSDLPRGPQDRLLVRGDPRPQGQ